MKSQDYETRMIDWKISSNWHEHLGYFVTLQAQMIFDSKNMNSIKKFLLNENRWTAIDGGMIDENIKKFLERYQHCSLETCLSLLFNPESDYYNLFPLKSNNRKGWRVALESLIKNLLDNRILLSGSARDQDNIRSAMRIFITSVASDDHLSIVRSNAMHLTDFWNNEEPQTLPGFEEETFGIVALKYTRSSLLVDMPVDIRYRIGGFLDLKSMLNSVTVVLKKSSNLKYHLATFIEFFSRVLSEASPEHQVDLLRALSSHCVSKFEPAKFERRVFLKILGYPAEIEGFSLSAAFLMAALRFVFGVSREQYPDHHPRVQEFMCSSETFEFDKLDYMFPVPEKNEPLLLGLLQACSGFLNALGVMVPSEKLVSFLSCFNYSYNSAHQMYSVLSQWLDDQSQSLQLKCFRQLVIQPCIKKSFPALSLKDFASSDQTNELYAEGGGFYDLLKSKHEQTLILAEQTMRNAMSGVFKDHIIRDTGP